jgi:uncharacterized protein (TIGR00296 family)
MGASSSPTSPPTSATNAVPDGAAAVVFARRALETLLAQGRVEDPAAPFRAEPLPPSFESALGVFVTLLEYPSGELRGCVGFPRAYLPLRKAIPHAAYSAAREDPRFPVVTRSELAHLTIEVSLLTPPQPLPEDARARWPGLVRVGEDGLIVEGRGASGLLLPQVAPEQGWNAERFLAGTCQKAGLSGSAWTRPGVRVYRFQARVFRESRPGGPPVPRS